MKITKYFLSMAAAVSMIAGCYKPEMIQIAAPEDVVAPVLEAVEGPIEITPANMGLENGADGVSVLQPMFIKPTADELYTHFETIAKSVPGAPMLLYNNPGRTGYGISQDIVERLCHTYDNVVGMKDSSGDITQTMEFVRRNRDVPRV